MRISTFFAGVLLLLVCAGCANGRQRFNATATAGSTFAGAAENQEYDRSSSGATDYRLRLADPGPF